MGNIKKATWMATGSLAVLVILGTADPSSTRLMPSFLSHEPVGVLPKSAIDEQAIRGVIVQFNRDLSTAYLQLDPAAITANPMGDSLRRGYAEEIAFLRRGGRALEMTVKDIRINTIARLPNEVLSVDTVESVKIRYLNATDGSESVAPATASYAMNYTLDKSGSGWKIVGVETMKVGERDE